MSCGDHIEMNTMEQVLVSLQTQTEGFTYHDTFGCGSVSMGGGGLGGVPTMDGNHADGHDNIFIGFQGMWFDAESGLYNTLHRSFDPYSGRWLSRDPKYFGETSRNLYGSMNAQWGTVTDPFGDDALDWLGGFVKGAIKAIAEPFLEVYDVARLSGAKAQGIDTEHVELYSGLGQAQRQRVEEGQSTIESATKGALEVPTNILTLGAYGVARGEYEIVAAFNRGEIDIDELDAAMGEMAGGASASTALSKVIQSRQRAPWAPNARGSGNPKPPLNYQKPTNPPQLPPDALRNDPGLRVMPPNPNIPDQQYGYWRIQRGPHYLDPSTMKQPSGVSKPGFQARTHVPLPPYPPLLPYAPYLYPELQDRQ